MPVLSIRHLTRYSYRRPVALGEHRMMFRPLESYDQRVLESTLVISPEPSRQRFIHDVFGNCVGLARFAGPTEELVFESRVRLDHTPHPVFEGLEEDTHFGDLPVAYPVEDLPDLLRSMERLHPDPQGKLERWARSFVRWRGPTNLLQLLVDITQAIHADFGYAKRLHGAPQAPVETLEQGAGSCRDFALLMMEAARSLGFAAQFVSGYIHTPPRQAGPLTRVGGGHTHAWVRVYLPVCGWVEFDPTNGIVGNVDLVRVAIARDPRQALPLSGTWMGQADDFLGMEVQVDVESEPNAAPAKTVEPVRQPNGYVGVSLAC